MSKLQQVGRQVVIGGTKQQVSSTAIVIVITMTDENKNKNGCRGSNKNSRNGSEMRIKKTVYKIENEKRETKKRKQSQVRYRSMNKTRIINLKRRNQKLVEKLRTENENKMTDDK